MDQGLVIVDAPPPPPLAKLPTPYHLYLLRLILVLCIYYALFADLKKDVDEYFYGRVVMMMIHVLDTVYFGTRYLSKNDAVDFSKYALQLAILFGLRLVVHVACFVLMWTVSVPVKGMPLHLAYSLTFLVDCTLMLDYNEVADRFKREEEAKQEREDRATYRYYCKWEPSNVLYFRIALRLGVAVLAIGAMLFDQADAIPSIHFPVRVFWCLVYITDSSHFFSRMYYANPQTTDEIYDYTRNLQRSHLTRFLLVFLPSLYFSFFANTCLMCSCGMATLTAVQIDQYFMNEHETYLKCRLRQKEINEWKRN